LFSTDERVEIVRGEMEYLDNGGADRIEVRPFDTLLMSFAESVGASVILRGLRAVSDFEYEFQMAGMNARLNPNIETVFLMASDRFQFISSRFVKEIGALGGDISHFVSPRVAERLYDRYGKTQPKRKSG
jgi:pantetheine-phosphate adenylyltransferase